MTEKEFIQKQSSLLQSSLRVFPDAFLADIPVREFSLPGSRLNLGEELFGNFEIIDTSGNTIHTAQDQYEAKYLVYASQQRRTTVNVPVNRSAYQQVAVAYEKYIDGLLKNLMQEYQSEFPQGKNPMQTVNEVLRMLGLVRF